MWPLSSKKWNPKLLSKLFFLLFLFLPIKRNLNNLFRFVSDSFNTIDLIDEKSNRTTDFLSSCTELLFQDKKWKNSTTGEREEIGLLTEKYFMCRIYQKYFLFSFSFSFLFFSFLLIHPFSKLLSIFF